MARIAFRNHFKIGSVAKCNKRHISWDFQPVSLAISSGNVGLITYGDDTLISGKKHDLKNESWKREPNAKPVTITQYGIYIHATCSYYFAINHFKALSRLAIHCCSSVMLIFNDHQQN